MFEFNPFTGTLDKVSDSPLGVTDGGTGTATQFTAGSVVFAGANGVYTEDNTNLKWNNTLKSLGIGGAPSVAKSLFVANPGSSGGGITLYNSAAGDARGEAFITGPPNLRLYLGSATVPMYSLNMSYCGSIENLPSIDVNTSVTSGGNLLIGRTSGASHVQVASGPYWQTLGLYTNATERILISSTGNVLINGFTNGTVGLTIKGAASQSANLQEWQNSSGTVLGYVSAAGNALFKGRLTAGDGAGGTTYDIEVNRTGANFSGYFFGSGYATMRVVGANDSAMIIGRTGNTADKRNYAWTTITGDKIKLGLINDAESSFTTDNIIVADSNGKVGIGNSSPSARLHITEPTLGNEVFRIESEATNDNPLEKMFQNRSATTNGTTTTIRTIAIPANTTVMVEVRFVSRRTGGTAGTAEDGGGAMIIELFKNVAGVATSIGSIFNTPVSDTGTWTFALTPSGGNVLAEVTGDADTNVTWHAHVRIWQVSS